MSSYVDYIIRRIPIILFICSLLLALSSRATEGGIGIGIGI